MESSQVKPSLLGFVDEFMEYDKEHFTTNKIGGDPDWCPLVKDPPVPLCGECGSQLLLVTQIYAPLNNSHFHRTLYIFGCIQSSCWNKSSTWACLRMQVAENIKEEPDSNTERLTKAVATDWLDGADDWGDESGPNDNDDNGNFNSISPDTSSPSPVGAVGGYPVCNFNLNDKMIVNSGDVGESLAQPLNNLNITGLRTDGTRANLNDSNANLSSPARGAKAQGTSMSNPTATAEIEMEADDSNIAIDSPMIGNTNIPNLFAAAIREVSSVGLKIQPYYIWVQEECIAPAAFDHEISLLNEYKAKEALEHIAEGGKDRKTKTSAASDTYEKSLPSHGDEYFHKMVSVIQNNPGQILRYGRDQGQPLLMRELSEEKQSCPHCGGATLFELQLLPSLVAQLKIPSLDGTPLEFGTVLIFTCIKSCWTEGDHQPRFEKIVVQGELM